MENKVIRIANLYGEDKGTSFAGNIWKTSGLSPSITTCGGGNREPMIIEKHHKNERTYV